MTAFTRFTHTRAHTSREPNGVTVEGAEASRVTEEEGAGATFFVVANGAAAAVGSIARRVVCDRADNTNTFTHT